MNPKSEKTAQRYTPSLSTKIPSSVTLGISTNTRLLGLAIINENDLVDYAIHLHKSSWSPSKVTRIVASLEPCVRKYCIKRVVLSIPYAHHQTEAFKEIIAAIKTYCHEQNIALHTETVEQTHSLYPPRSKKSKKALMEYLATAYPSLRVCYAKEMRNKTKYYVKVFEAAAVATITENQNPH